MINHRATRGYGLLEGFLVNLRCRQAERHIPPAYRQGRVLDVGCGASPFFLIRTTFAEKYGLDKTINDHHSQGSREYGITLVRHDIEEDGSLPFTDGYFDVITMLAVYEHIEHDRLVHVLEEIYRALKPGGIHLATTPTAWTNRLLKRMARLRLVSPAEIAEHKEAYTRPRLLSTLRKTPFSRHKVECGYFEMSMNLWVKATK